ncbi:L,D-transpeptidase [Mesorhizobium xinjiangense]|uniref:L,D-transpeptidase n=1 Tax=Mesorhizobium xinjiangense TaxID=2678685 RepID=UPI0012EDC061|nr:L,D-transpeptidase [Mesorhizobium xinjiangense]
MSTSSAFHARLDRRAFLRASIAGAASASLASCTTLGEPSGPASGTKTPSDLHIDESMAGYRTMYGPVADGGFEIPPVPVQKIEEQFLRQIVTDPTGERPGSVVVDTSNHYLYLVRESGQAIRYGVGLGRAGFEWSGRALIQWKRPWPTWTPPDEMIARSPDLEKYSVRNGGMAPGLKNPLGARALYIFQDGKDTLYRVHGSPEWWTIGKSVSSGCVRMVNQDVIDLYSRVPNKTPIVVY